MKDTGKKTLENSQKEKQEWWLTDQKPKVSGITLLKF